MLCGTDNILSNFPHISTPYCNLCLFINYLDYNLRYVPNVNVMNHKFFAIVSFTYIIRKKFKVFY